ncbi:MAG: hypothetical protein RLP44_12155 [Aggregatilineales bacterium]
MPTKQIPDRLPIGDSVHGALLRLNTSYLLALSADVEDTEQETFTLVKQGDFTIRYGIAYLGKPHLSIVPGLLALDYGEILNGEDAFNFILHKSNLYPRSDAIGYRNDGVDDMIVLKWLDLALPLHVLVYADAESTVPLAQINSVILPQNGSTESNLPDRLRENTTQYETIAAWRQKQIDS